MQVLVKFNYRVVFEQNHWVIILCGLFFSFYWFKIIIQGVPEDNDYQMMNIIS